MSLKEQQKLKQKTKLSKEKDVELMKQKISMLREQLSAAEKILNINEENLKVLKTNETNIDTKLIKLQNMKKTQQQLLQKILTMPSMSDSLLTQSSSDSALLKKKDVCIEINQSTEPPLPPLVNISYSSVTASFNLRFYMLNVVGRMNDLRI